MCIRDSPCFGFIFEEYPDTVHMHCSPCMICRDKDIIFFLFQFYKTKALMITDKSSFFDQSPVSYTHLDVYKRQHLPSARPDPADPADFLLYYKIPPASPAKSSPYILCIMYPV